MLAGDAVAGAVSCTGSVDRGASARNLQFFAFVTGRLRNLSRADRFKILPGSSIQLIIRLGLYVSSPVDANRSLVV